MSNRPRLVKPLAPSPQDEVAELVRPATAADRLARRVLELSERLGRAAELTP